MGYVIFTTSFVNLLVLKGLVPELPPIDRQRTDPQIGLGYCAYYSDQPDLRIPTRSTGSSPPRDLASRRLVHRCLPPPGIDPPHDRRGLAGRFLRSAVQWLPP